MKRAMEVEEEVELKLKFYTREDDDLNDVEDSGYELDRKEEEGSIQTDPNLQKLYKTHIYRRVPMHQRRVLLNKRAADIAACITSRLSPPSMGGCVEVPQDAPLRVFYRNQDQSFAVACDDFTGLFSSPAMTRASTGHLLLQPKDFELVNLHGVLPGIVARVEQMMRDKMVTGLNIPVEVPSKLVPELEELRIIEAGSGKLSFTRDTDGWTLLIFLPSPFLGGEVLTGDNQQEVFDHGERVSSSGSSKLLFLCTRSKAYFVNPVQSGYQVTLVYRLNEVIKETDKLPEVWFRSGLEDKFREALSKPGFYKDGTLLAFPCQEYYQILQEYAGQVLKVRNPKDLAAALVGLDAELYHSALAAGLHAQVRPVWEGDFVADKAYGLIVSTETYHAWNDDDDDDNVQSIRRQFFKRRNLTWCHDNGFWSDGLVAYEIENHKRGDMEYLKRMLAILVEIPSWEKREAAAGEEQKAKQFKSE